jgi:hypothetical protein
MGFLSPPALVLGGSALPGRRQAVAFTHGGKAAAKVAGGKLAKAEHPRMVPDRAVPATALKMAQEVVRGREDWQHPHYWAAWELRGLPN